MVEKPDGARLSNDNLYFLQSRILFEPVVCSERTFSADRGRGDRIKKSDTRSACQIFKGRYHEIIRQNYERK